MRSVDDDAHDNDGCAKQVNQDFFNPADPEQDDTDIQDDKVYAYFGRPAAQIGHLKLAGRSKGQIGADHETAGNGYKQINHLPAGAIEQERITDQNRTHENEVQKMVHVIAPFRDAGVSVSAQ